MREPCRLQLVHTSALLLLAAAQPLHAEDRERSLVVLAGLNLGTAHTDDVKGPLVGGEVSVAVANLSRLGLFGRRPVWAPDSWPTWIGGYADVTHVDAAQRTMVSLGPEVGFGPFGLDGGVAFSGDHVGWAIRPVLTVGYLTVYARGGRLDGAGFGQFGVLLKWGKPIARL